MGRNRRERRAAQAERALEEGDLKGLGALVEKSPELCAQKLAEAGARLPADAPSELDAIAIPLCGSLRRSGKLSAATKLASAFAHRSPRMRLEQALSLFAQGNDAEAERACASDPLVQSVMTPLLDASRAVTSEALGAGQAKATPSDDPEKTAKGASKGSPKTSRKRMDGRTTALHALHLVAGATRVTSRRDTRALHTARARIERAKIPCSGAFPAAEMMAALDALAGRLDRATPALLGSSTVRERPDIAKAAVRAIALHDREGALRAGQQLGFSGDALRAMGIGTSARLLRQGEPTQLALQVAESDGATAFAPQHRGAASIYEGFACLHTDSKRAGQAFDRAIALGADLLEALRGKLLLSLEPSEKECAECGKIHYGMDDGEPDPRKLAVAADRFARAARHTQGGAPFAAEASLEAAAAWIAVGNEKAALASIDAARGAANGSGALSERLTLQEAKARFLSNPARAEALLDDLLKRSPHNVRAWKDRIELADALGQSKKAADLLVAAANATQDPELSAQARDVRLKRGLIKPFEGLIPGTATAGELAQHVRALVKQSGINADLPEIAVACRDALPEMEQLAVDAAHVAIVVHTAARTPDGKPAPQLLFAKKIEAWWGSPAILSKLAALAWAFGLESAIGSTARRLASRNDAGPALGALFDAARSAQDTEVAKELLKLGAIHWSRSATQERRRAIERLARAKRPGYDLLGHRPMTLQDKGAQLSPDAVMRALDALLAPSIRLDSIWNDQPDILDEEDFGEELDLTDILSEMDSMLGGPNGLAPKSPARALLSPEALETFKAMGLRPDVIKRLSFAQRQRIETLMDDFASQPFSPSRYEKLLRDIQKVIQAR